MKDETHEMERIMQQQRNRVRLKPTLSVAPSAEELVQRRGPKPVPKRYPEDRSHRGGGE